MELEQCQQPSSQVVSAMHHLMDYLAIDLRELLNIIL